MKTRTLFKQVGKYQVTNASIIQALRELNDEAEGHLGAFPQVVPSLTLDPSTINGVYHYCESLELSVERIGMWIRAFKLKGRLIATIKEGGFR